MGLDDVTVRRSEILHWVAQLHRVPIDVELSLTIHNPRTARVYASSDWGRAKIVLPVHNTSDAVRRALAARAVCRLYYQEHQAPGELFAAEIDLDNPNDIDRIVDVMEDDTPRGRWISEWLVEVLFHDKPLSPDRYRNVVTLAADAGIPPASIHKFLRAQFRRHTEELCRFKRNLEPLIVRYRSEAHPPYQRTTGSSAILV